LWGTPEQNREVKREAIERVNRHANEEWRDFARVTLEAMAFKNRYITADTLWREIEKNPDFETHTRKAIGAIFIWGAKHKIIRKVEGKIVESERTERHCGILQVWESLIYRGDAKAAD